MNYNPYIKINFKGLRMRWSEEDQSFVTTHSTWPSLCYLHSDPVKSVQGMIDLIIEEVLDEGWK